MKKILKQKDVSSNLVTKDFFRKELRQELNGTIERLLHGIRQEITFAMDTVADKFENKLNKHTSLILTTVDPLLKELETRREDRAISASQHLKLKNQVDNHEKRIKKIERIQQTA